MSTKAEDNERFVRAYQTKLGLRADGWAGVNTFDSLYEAGQAPSGQTLSTFKTGDFTEKVCLEILSHEAIIREAYKDSVGVWTWSAGITSASGHSVERYKDNPQTIQRCLEVFVWLLKTKYGPEVLAAFKGHRLTEEQWAAAVSFHWNTGAIGRASWVELWKAGRVAEAKAKFMEWRKPADIIKRREAERDLFFDGKWSNDGKTTTYDVAKPSYAPRWSSAKRIDIRTDLKEALAKA